MNGDVDISGVTLDGSINGSYISLGHQPLAKILRIIYRFLILQETVLPLQLK